MRFALIALCLWTGSRAASAAELALAGAGTGASRIELVRDALESRTDPCLELLCHVDRLSLSEVDTPRGRFTHVSIPGFHHTGEIGAPALPVITRLLEVPLGSRIDVSARGGTVRTVRLEELGIQHPISPRQPPRPKDGRTTGFAYRESAYASDARGTDALVAVEDLGLLRDKRLVLVKVAPLAYDPRGRRLEIRNDLRITLSLAGADLAETIRMKEAYVSPAFSVVDGQILRPGSLLHGRARSGSPGYLIVADRKFEAALAPFIAAKVARGFQVSTAFTDTIGRTPDRIRAYVKNLYDSPPADMEAPSFLLLVGDHEEIPAFPGRVQAGIPPGEHITDLYYAAVTSGDDLPDILVGRFSARTVDELTPQIEKTLQYERDPTSDPALRRSAVLVAGWDSGHAVEWGWPQVNFGTRHRFNAAHGVPEARPFLSSGPQQNARAIIDLINRGASFVNYTAHGSQQRWSDPQISVFDVGELRNAGKYPLVIGNCCLSNAFQLDRCFGEAWLRARGKGAIGYIGASDNTFWDEDLWWSVGSYSILHPNPGGTPPAPELVNGGAFNAILPRGALTSAGILLAGNLSVQQSDSQARRYYWEIYHLMGDPSLVPRIGAPR